MALKEEPLFFWEISLETVGCLAITEL
jgi:hypothetical protein